VTGLASGFLVHEPEDQVLELFFVIRSPRPRRVLSPMSTLPSAGARAVRTNTSVRTFSLLRPFVVD
jgi:hypothetical protein